MHHLNSSSPSGSEWDSNYARIYLKVSEDQLEIINKIPGWSETDISKATASENDKNSENIKKQTSTENNLTISTNISVKDNDNLKNQNYDSDIQSKKNSVTPLHEKELFLEKASFSPLRKKYTFKRSNSLPDLCEKLLSTEVTSRCNSEEIYRKEILSVEKDISNSKLTTLLRKNILNKTYTVPGISDDCLNHNKLLEISLKSLTSASENPHQVSRQKFQTLDDSILNHKYLKGIETSAITSKVNPLFSNGTIQPTLKQGRSLFEKKLLLLEERLSPSKEMSQPPFNSKIINLENLNLKKNGKLAQSSPKADEIMTSMVSVDEVVTAVVSADSVDELPDEVKSSAGSKSCKSFESQSVNEIASKYKDRSGNIPKTAACNFDSFLTPPLPCGQPVPTEIPSHSQLIPSQKATEINSLQNTSPPYPCGQLLPLEVPSLSQPILSQKSVKLSTPNKSQDIDLVCKQMAPEKSSGTFSVFSANLNEKVSDIASEKEVCSKRKRKNRSEKSSKKLKKIDIQFSSAQIKNMIEIMKIFHREF